MRQPTTQYMGVRPLDSDKGAFTLVEILIVVIVLGVLAAIVVPRFTNAATSALDASVTANVRTLNTQAELLFRSHRAKHSPESEWITTVEKLKATVNEQLLSDWTVNGNTFIAPNKRCFSLTLETASSAARLEEIEQESTESSDDESGTESETSEPSETSTEGFTKEQIQALSIAEIVNAELTAEQVSWLTPEQLAALSNHDLASFSLEEIQALSAEQIDSLTHDQFAAIAGSLSPEQLAACRPQQIAALSQDVYDSLSSEQREALTEAQLDERAIADAVRELSYTHFGSLTAQQIPYLTPEQIASIPSDYYMNTLSEELRAELTREQVQAIDTSRVSVSYLTESQRQYITDDQYAAMAKQGDIQYVPPEKVPLLSLDLMASISSDWYMSQNPEEVRAAFTTEQVQAINTSKVSVSYLTESQRQYITDDQYAAMAKQGDIQYVPPEKVPLLSLDLMASISSDWYMSQNPEEVRAAFTTEQVQAINTSKVSVSYLTESQRQYITDDQYAAMAKQGDIQYVPPEKVPLLSLDLMASISSDWYMSQNPEEVRAAFTAEQVQAIDTSAVSIKYLTQDQRDELTSSQVQALRSSDLSLISVAQVPDVTTSQLSSATSSYYFGQIPVSNLQALNQEQVLAISETIFNQFKDRFTEEQQGWRE